MDSCVRTGQRNARKGIAIGGHKTIHAADLHARPVRQSSTDATCDQYLGPAVIERQRKAVARLASCGTLYNPHATRVNTKHAPHAAPNPKALNMRSLSYGSRMAPTLRIALSYWLGARAVP